MRTEGYGAGILWPRTDVQLWLGHSSFSTTANIYAHIDVDSKMEAANMIASKINLGELPEKKKSPKRKIA